MKSIQLLPAFSWICEDCGKRNFERGIVMEMSEEDKEEMKAEMGIEPLENGEFLRFPEIVTCYFCSESFKATEE